MFDGEYLEGIFQDKTRGYYARNKDGHQSSRGQAGKHCYIHLPSKYLLETLEEEEEANRNI